jgi:hypothetical protein
MVAHLPCIDLRAVWIASTAIALAAGGGAVAADAEGGVRLAVLPLSPGASPDCLPPPPTTAPLPAAPCVYVCVCVCVFVCVRVRVRACLMQAEACV